MMTKIILILIFCLLTMINKNNSYLTLIKTPQILLLLIIGEKHDELYKYIFKTITNSIVKKLQFKNYNFYYENLKGSIIISNHLSFIDFVIINSLYPSYIIARFTKNYHMVYKQKIIKYISDKYRAIHYVSKYESKYYNNKMNKKIDNLLDEGKNILSFAEGKYSFNCNGLLCEFKKKFLKKVSIITLT